MHQDRADKDEIPNARRNRRARQMQRAFDIDVAVKLDRLLVGLLVNARRKMNNSVDALERGAPIGGGAERADRHVVCIQRQGAHRTPHQPVVLRQLGHHMATDKAARTCHQNRPAAIIHAVRSTSRSDNSSATSAA
jgi:hypothetical protein